MVLKVANPSQLATSPPERRSRMKDYLSSIKIGDDARTFGSSYTYPKLRNHAD